MTKRPNKENQRIQRSRTDRERDEIRLDTILEKWEHSGNYREFFKRHVKTLGVHKMSQEEVREGMKRALDGVKRLDIPWSKLSPKERARIIANLSRRMREGDMDDCYEREKGPKGTKKKKKDKDDDDDCDDDDRHRNQRGRGHDDDKPGERKGHRKCKKPKKKKKIKKRKCHRPPKGERPKPPKCNPPEEEDPDEEVPTDPPDVPPPYEPGTPDPPESPPPLTPAPPKEQFSSRIGYFVSLSELRFYTEEPALYQTPDIEFSFQDLEGSYLSLEGGDVWMSEWQEGPVIRGLDLSINGQHRLKYSSNGDFEIG